MESVNATKTTGDQRQGNSRSALALAIAKKLRRVDATRQADIPSTTILGPNNAKGTSNAAPPLAHPNAAQRTGSNSGRMSSKMSRLARLGGSGPRPSMMKPMKPGGPSAPTTPSNSPAGSSVATLSEKRRVPMGNRAAVAKKAPGVRVPMYNSAQQRNRLLSTRPGVVPDGPTSRKVTDGTDGSRRPASNLSRAFGRHAGQVRSNFAPPGSRSGQPMAPQSVARGKAKMKSTARPKAASKLHSRFGGRGGVVASAGIRVDLGVVRGGGPISARGGRALRRANGRPMLGNVGTRVQMRPMANPLMKLEDIYGDESDDWIVEDNEHAEAEGTWRTELSGTAFDYDKYRHVNVDDAQMMVSSGMQVEREEAHAARIAREEERREERLLMRERHEDQEEEEDEEDEDLEGTEGWIVDD